MAEPILDASSVVAAIGQGVAAGVAQHVSVDRKCEARLAASRLTIRQRARASSNGRRVAGKRRLH
jgi:hypothetical protein